MGCEAPHLRCIRQILGMDLVAPDLSVNLHIYDPSGWASVMTSPLSRRGVMISSAVVPFISGRRYGSAPPFVR